MRKRFDIYQRAQIKKITIIALLAIYIIFSIIPVVIGKKLTINESKTVSHPIRHGYYRLEVEAGSTYSIYLSIPYPYENPPKYSIRIYSRALRITGIQDRLVHFRASHSGFYYATIINSKGGPFRIQFYKNSDVELSSEPCITIWKIALFVLIGIISVNKIRTPPGKYNPNPISMYRIKSYLKLYRSTKKTKFRSKRSLCPQCGNNYEKYPKFCAVCGYIYLKPKNYASDINIEQI